MVYVLSVIGSLAFVLALMLRGKEFVSNIVSTKGDVFLLMVAWFLMYFGMGLFFRREGFVTGFSGIDKSAIFQLSCVAVASLCLLLIKRGGAMRYLSLAPMVGLLIYGFVAILSVGVSPAPVISLYKALLLFVDVYLIVVTVNILSRVNIHYPLEICYFITFLFSAGALIGVLVDPATALKPSGGAIGVLLRGSYPVMNSNELGFLGGVTLVVGLLRLHVRQGLAQKMFWLCFAIVGAIVLVLAQARTSLATALIAIIFLSSVVKSMGWLKHAALIAVILSVMYSVVSGEMAGWQQSLVDVTVEYAQRGQDEQGLQTLTGRAEAWMSIGLRMLADSPFIGHGYDAGVRYADEYGMSGSHMHNSHFQILANTGVLGYLAWFVMVVSVSIMVLKRFISSRRHYTVHDLIMTEISAVYILILLRTITGQVMVTHQWSLLIFLGGYVFARLYKPGGSDLMSDDKIKPDTVRDRVLYKKDATIMRKK